MAEVIGHAGCMIPPAGSNHRYANRKLAPPVLCMHTQDSTDLTLMGLNSCGPAHWLPPFPSSIQFLCQTQPLHVITIVNPISGQSFAPPLPAPSWPHTFRVSQVLSVRHLAAEQTEKPRGRQGRTRHVPLGERMLRSCCGIVPSRVPGSGPAGRGRRRRSGRRFRLTYPYAPCLHPSLVCFQPANCNTPVTA